jgi:hypothetical protein
MNDDSDTPWTQRSLNADEAAVERSFRAGFNNLLWWAFWPAPGACVAFVFGGWLFAAPFLSRIGGLLFLGYVGTWLYTRRHVATGWVTLFWDWVVRHVLALLGQVRIAGPAVTKGHQDQLAETQAMLSMVARERADPTIPDSQRFVTDAEHGAELRLEVLLNKPKLTLEEKRERDAIQAFLGNIRRSPPAGLWAPNHPAPAPQAFLGAAVAASPLGFLRWWREFAMAALAIFGIMQGARAAHLDRQADRLADEARELRETVIIQQREYADLREQHMRDVSDVLKRNETILAEQQRQRALADRLQRRRDASYARELESLRTGDPPPIDDWVSELGEPAASPSEPPPATAASPGDHSSG